MEIEREIELLEKNLDLLRKIKELSDALDLKTAPVYIPYPVYPPTINPPITYPYNPHWTNPYVWCSTGSTASLPTDNVTFTN